MNGLDYFSAIQQAIAGLITTFEPEFLRFGLSMFLSFATVRIGWNGVEMMLSSQPLNDKIFAFAKLLLLLSFGYAMMAFYESPIPGIGSSFSNLITDQTANFANTLDAAAVGNVYDHFNAMQAKTIAPSALEVTAGFLYMILIFIVGAAKALSVIIVAFGLIGSAICGLVGPIFVPFFIVPQLDRLFWGWFWAFLQYSFMPVTAYAYLMVFERFLFNFLDRLPDGITSDLYATYGIQIIGVGIVFIVGILYVPSLNATIFSGHGGQNPFDRLFR
jgi:hypothetical protein